MRFVHGICCLVDIVAAVRKIVKLDRFNLSENYIFMLSISFCVLIRQRTRLIGVQIKYILRDLREMSCFPERCSKTNMFEWKYQSKIESITKSYIEKKEIRAKKEIFIFYIFQILRYYMLCMKNYFIMFQNHSNKMLHSLQKCFNIKYLNNLLEGYI